MHYFAHDLKQDRPLGPVGSERCMVDASARLLNDILEGSNQKVAGVVCTKASPSPWQCAW